MSNFRATLDSLKAAFELHEAQKADYIARLERKAERLALERDELVQILKDHDILRDGKLRER